MLPVSQVSPASRNLDPVRLGIQRAPGFVSEENQSFPEQGEQLGFHSLVTMVTVEMGAEQNELREAEVFLMYLSFRDFCTLQNYYAIFVLIL